MQSSIGGRLNPRRILLFIYAPKIRWPKRLNSAPPYHHRPARRLFQMYTNDTVTFWLVVGSSHPAEAIETHGPITLSIFIFFVTHFVA
jgi:hypothetical protein